MTSYKSLLAVRERRAALTLEGRRLFLLGEPSQSKQIFKREASYPGDHPILFNEVLIKKGINVW